MEVQEAEAPMKTRRPSSLAEDNKAEETELPNKCPRARRRAAPRLETTSQFHKGHQTFKTEARA